MRLPDPDAASVLRRLLSLDQPDEKFSKYAKNVRRGVLGPGGWRLAELEVAQLVLDRRLVVHALDQPGADLLELRRDFEAALERLLDLEREAHRMMAGDGVQRSLRTKNGLRFLRHAARCDRCTACSGVNLSWIKSVSTARKELDEDESSAA